VVSRVYQIADALEIARRRALLPPGSFVEAWPDLYTPGHAWVSAETKSLLDGCGGVLPAVQWVDGTAVAVYYGSSVQDVASLPTEESLRARVLSAHGIAVAWATLDRFGAPIEYQPESPLDPVFFLRRPGGTVAHRWRLFRTRQEAVVFMREFYANNRDAGEWAARLPAATYDALLARHGGRGD
jgi:hypothetical protein